jgi:ribonuclease HI/probable phosphoglycerate mutase
MGRGSERVRLHADGASRGNPGPAGAAAVLFGKEDEILFEWKSFLGTCTNNEAEYQGLILGLTESIAKGYRNLSIFLDSELVVRQLTGRYRVKNERLKKLYDRTSALLGRLESWTVDHVGREKNREADRLANEAIDGGLAIR